MACPKLILCGLYVHFVTEVTTSKISAVSKMLACIEVLLRVYPAFREVEFSTDAIMSFLGPSPSLALREASSLGSIKLLDWIWTSSCTSIDTRVPQWTLTNYLRSDPHYYCFQFSMGLEEAAGRGDLEVVKWLFAHFTGCEAPKTVVDAAASKGHLHVLEFLWAHSCSGTVEKKRKLVAADGVVIAERLAGNFTQRCGGDNVVLWEDGAMLCAVTNGHFHVVRWLCEFTPHDKLSSNYDQGIKHALRAGDDDLVRFLLPPGRCVLDYAAECPRLDVIEWMLDCGYLRRDIKSAACAIRDLAGTGRLDLMQQIALMHSPLPRYYAQWFTSDLWYDAIGKACEGGGLATFQWLIEYPIQIKIWQLSKELQYRRNPFVLAASTGQWRIVEYLCRRKIAEEINRSTDSMYDLPTDTVLLYMYDDMAPLRNAIRHGHIRCVEVIVKAFLYAKRRPNFSPVEFAADSGQLGVLKFLLTFHPEGVTHLEDAWWTQSRDLISCAARDGHLDLVKWLHENYPGNCGTDAMDGAAAGGHLDVVQWLHANRREGCTKNAMHSAAVHGNLDVVQWLHDNGLDGCLQHTIQMAASFGHLDVVKWLFKHLPDRCACTVDMVKDATLNGPLRIAVWLHNEFPGCVPADLNEVRITYNSDKFEMLLFQCEHYPHLITTNFAADTLGFIERYGSWTERVHMVEWLEEHTERVKSHSSADESVQTH